MPKGMIGVPCVAQTRTIAATSSVELGEGDGVGRMPLVPGHVLAVLLADRGGGRQPVAEEGAELCDGGLGIDPGKAGSLHGADHATAANPCHLRCRTLDPTPPSPYSAGTARV